MKYLTIVVPCFNSEAYMQRCLDSLLEGGDKVEILVVDDGSSDGTGEIADEYQRRFPHMITSIRQENRGHGGAVNTGLEHASGLFFKVVDSDDWIQAGALKEILSKIEEWESAETSVDMIVSNYTYNHLHEGTCQEIDYRNIFTPEVPCSWEESKRFAPSQYLVMHALIFRTAVLRDSGVDLPRHTFYVDNLFAYQPLPRVNTICYLDHDFYHYFIGRDDQSVNEKVLCERIDQHIRVTKSVIDCVDLRSVASERLRSYMLRNVSIMMSISSIHLLLINSQDAIAKRDDLWEYAKKRMPHAYKRLRFTHLSGFTYLPTRLGRWLTITGYQAAKRMYRFQ